MEIFTLGHSLRPLTEVRELLDEHRIGFVCDVRRMPGERRNPGFGQEAMERACLEQGITYVALGRQLGGARAEGYRAHLESESFREGFQELTELARRKRTAVFCREALYFRCVRKYLADELTRTGWVVTHLLEPDRSFRHRIGSYRMSPHPDECE